MCVCVCVCVCIRSYDVTNEVQTKGRRLYGKLNGRYTETFIGDSKIISFQDVIPDICGGGGRVLSLPNSHVKRPLLAENVNE